MKKAIDRGGEGLGWENLDQFDMHITVDREVSFREVTHLRVTRSEGGDLYGQQ